MTIEKLAKTLYKGRNKSHGFAHAKKVRNTAIILSKLLNIDNKTTLIKIETAALFNDYWDRKYITIYSNQYEKLRSNFESKLKKLYYSDHDIKDIEIINNNISLSFEMSMHESDKCIDLKHLQLIRDIVSDADKIEMLGISGIERIVDYQLYQYPDTNSNDLKKIVKKIYNEKLSKLISDGYIKTKPGIKLALPLMKQMDIFINLIHIEDKKI